MDITKNERIALNMLALNLYTQSNGARPTEYNDVSGGVWSNCLDSHNATESLKGRTLSATCASLAKKGLVSTYNDTRTRAERRGEPNGSTITLTEAGFAAWQEAFPEPSEPRFKRVLGEQGAVVGPDSVQDYERAVTSGPVYDAKQTELCDRVKSFLQSIAILAVQAQDLDPSGDKLGDTLGDIESDLARLREAHQSLQRNDFCE